MCVIADCVCKCVQAKHAKGANTTWGIDGNSVSVVVVWWCSYGQGELIDMNILNVWEPFSVKAQVLKTATETAMMLMRIDAIVSGMKKPKGAQQQQQQPQGEEGAPQEE